MKFGKKAQVAIAMSLAVVGLAGCSTDADVASENLSEDADNFKIVRRVVFFNGITDNYLLSIEGRCSIVHEQGQLEVTCKLGEGEFKKHFLGLSDNVSYFVEQMKPAKASTDHYKVTFKPESVVPSVDAR